MTEKEALSIEIRNVLGEHNDPDKPVVELIKQLVEDFEEHKEEVRNATIDASEYV